MSTDPNRLLRRVERATNARKQAEQLLETKSRALYEANQRLQKVQEGLEERVEERTELARRRETYMRMLFDVTADSNLPINGQILHALKQVVGALGVAAAIIGEVSGELYIPRWWVAASDSVIDYKQPIPLPGTYAQLVIDAEAPVAISNISASDGDLHPKLGDFRLEAYLGSRINVHGELYGVIGFGLNDPRETPFDDIDRDFISLLSRWIGTMIERLHAQRSLQEVVAETRKLSLVASLTDNMVVVTGPEGNIEWVNSAFERVTGYTADETIGKRPGQMLQGPDTDPETVLYMREQLAKQEAFKCEILNYTKSGEPYWIALEVQPAYDESGVLTNFIAIESDITGQRAAQERLENSQKRFSTLFHASNDGIFIHDPQGQILDVNQKVVDMLGYPRDELIGVNVKNLHPMSSMQRAKAAIADLTISGAANFEIEFIHKDGSQFPVEISASLIEIDGTFVAQSIVRDISERRATLEALEDARQAAEDASRTKSAFLATMSHEIRTPLNAIIGMCNVLLDSPMTPDQQESAQIIHSSSDSLLAIINDILDFSKIEAGRLDLEEQAFDLRRCVEDSLDMVASKAGDKQIDLAYIYQPNAPEFVIGDITRLRQILVNLLSNAVKFTHVGEVVVGVNAKWVKGSDELTLELSVRDTGIGIAEDRLNRLFKSFSQVDASTTRQYGGTGLGLAISKKLSQLMGGDIKVTSKAGVGSTFTCSIQVKEAPNDNRYDFLDEELPDLSGKRILIVDDNQTNRRILEHQLNTWGMEVEVAESGYEALGIVATQEPFDVAIIDIFMPRMDGIELSGKLRGLAPKLPQIVLSSSSRSELSEGALDVFAYLNKPLKPLQLHRYLLDLFAGRQVVMKNKSRAEFDPDMGRRHPLRILIAEDNAVNQRVALRILEKLGYRADVAGNGYEALGAIAMRTYDIVLMDVHMPEMDGITATKRIIADFEARPRIVAMTANAMKGDREKYLAVGMDDYVSKPVRIQALVEALERTPSRSAENEIPKPLPAPPPVANKPSLTAIALVVDDGPPAIDFAALEQQFGDMAAEMLEELWDLFDEEAGDLAAQMSDAVEQGELEAYYRAAHGMKGMSLNIGANTLASFSSVAEKAGKAGQADEAFAQMGFISAELQRVRAYYAQTYA